MLKGRKSYKSHIIVKFNNSMYGICLLSDKFNIGVVLQKCEIRPFPDQFVVCVDCPSALH